jgi:hypothetical protein
VSRNAVHAILEEWDRARLEVVALLPRIRAAEFVNGDPRDASCVRGILTHVVRAGYNYAKWICDVLEFPPPRAADLTMLSGREAFARAFEDLRADFFAALAPLTDDHLDPTPGGDPPPHFRARWGEDYGVEQMLEHAICHNLRHRRQLERMSIFDA